MLSADKRPFDSRKSCPKGKTARTTCNRARTHGSSVLAALAAELRAEYDIRECLRNSWMTRFNALPRLPSGRTSTRWTRSGSERLRRLIACEGDVISTPSPGSVTRMGRRERPDGAAGCFGTHDSFAIKIAEIWLAVRASLVRNISHGEGGGSDVDSRRRCGWNNDRLIRP